MANNSFVISDSLWTGLSTAVTASDIGHYSYSSLL